MKLFIKRVLLLLLTLSNSNLYAQKQGQPRIDSLLKELPKQKEDTNRVNLLNSLSWDYSSINPTEGIKYGQQGLDLATKLAWKEGIAWGNHSLGSNYQHKSDYPKAIEYEFKALKISEEIGNKKGTADITMGIGIIYQYQSDYTKALEYFFKALKIGEEIGNKLDIVRTTGNIGLVYQNQSDYPTALEYDLYFTRDKLVDCFYQRIGTSS